MLPAISTPATGRSAPHSSAGVYYSKHDMGAVLVGKDGPPKGRLVPLGELGVSVGRDEARSRSAEQASDLTPLVVRTEVKWE